MLLALSQPGGPRLPLTAKGEAGTPQARPALTGRTEALRAWSSGGSRARALRTSCSPGGLLLSGFIQLLGISWTQGLGRFHGAERS